MYNAYPCFVCIIHRITAMVCNHYTHVQHISLFFPQKFGQKKRCPLCVAKYRVYIFIPLTLKKHLQNLIILGHKKLQFSMNRSSCNLRLYKSVANDDQKNSSAFPVLRTPGKCNAVITSRVPGLIFSFFVCRFSCCFTYPTFSLNNENFCLSFSHLCIACFVT